MLLTNTRLAAPRIELAFHRAVQITDINDASVAVTRFVKVFEFEFMVSVWVVVVAIPGQ
jgi:hypothetical protein